MVEKNEQWIIEFLDLRGWSLKGRTFVKRRNGCKTVLVLPMSYLLTCKGSMTRHIERLESSLHTYY